MPCPSWPSPCTTRQCPYTLPKIAVPASTVCAVRSCSFVWPVCLDSAMLIASLPCLTSYTWGLRALVVYGKHPSRSASSVLLPCPWGAFPRGSYWLTPWRARSRLSKNLESWLYCSPFPYPSRVWTPSMSDHCSPGCLQSWCHGWAHWHWWPSGPVLNPLR